MKAFFIFMGFVLAPLDLYAFCGFYVAKGGADLFNKSSQVVLVRNKENTVISMRNDYEGAFTNFALIVPVPVILKKEQVNVGDNKMFDRIDSFTSPRLVEYYDENPCRDNVIMKSRRDSDRMMPMESASYQKNSLAVTVEEKFTAGEYDIVILSAKESDGLEAWLRQNNYNIPEKAGQALAPYIKQNMKFFVAKVNLKKQEQTGLTYLRPLQFAFESKKFMLPIRLGLLNAKGPQDLFVYILTKKGRVETSNYRTVKLPTDEGIPVYIKDKFDDFYKALFAEQVRKEKMKTVFLEYFWDMSWCDPCAADPLTAEELKKLGVFWIKNTNRSTRGQDVKVTRLHVRYTQKTFPQDLMFQETKDNRNFQARYVLSHPWEGSPKECEEAEDYFKRLMTRQEEEMQTLAWLTSWDINKIREEARVYKPENQTKAKEPFWKNLW